MSDSHEKLTEILTFFISGKLFGIWPKDLQEIVEDCDYVPVPNAPEFLKGIINSHGRIFSVIDMTEMLKDHSLSLGAPRRIAILKNEDFMTGILVPSQLSISLYPGNIEEKEEVIGFFRGFTIVNGQEEVTINILEAGRIFDFLRDYFKKRSIIAA